MSSNHSQLVLLLLVGRGAWTEKFRAVLWHREDRTKICSISLWIQNPYQTFLGGSQWKNKKNGLISPPPELNQATCS